VAAYVFRFYSFEPKDMFVMVGENWPAALVRRNAWKIGASDIWYSTVAFDEATAAKEFEDWLSANSRKADIRGYLGSASGTAYRGIALHDPNGLTNRLGDKYCVTRARYRASVRLVIRLYFQALRRLKFRQ